MTAITARDLEGRIWHTTAQAAVYAECHPQTILSALQAGELKGSQRKAQGRWRIHRDDLDKWLRGEK